MSTSVLNINTVVILRKHTCISHSWTGPSGQQYRMQFCWLIKWVIPQQINMGRSLWTLWQSGKLSRRWSRHTKTRSAIYTLQIKASFHLVPLDAADAAEAGPLQTSDFYFVIQNIHFQCTLKKWNSDANDCTNRHWQICWKKSIMVICSLCTRIHVGMNMLKRATGAF